jgi:hypothetical protein
MLALHRFRSATMIFVLVHLAVVWCGCKDPVTGCGMDTLSQGFTVVLYGYPVTVQGQPVWGWPGSCSCCNDGGHGLLLVHLRIQNKLISRAQKLGLF